MAVNDKKQEAEIRCSKCGYKWTYTGELWKATCPRCGSKTKTHLYPDDK